MIKVAAKLAVATLGVIFLIISGFSGKAAAVLPDLYVREISITGSEFVVLQAGTDIQHLSDYWLGYIGSDSGTATPSQQLADLPISTGESILLNTSAMPVCDARYEDSLGFSAFSNTRGKVGIWKLSGGNFTPIGSTVTWGTGTFGSPPQIDDIKISVGSSLTNPVWFNDPVYGWVVGSSQGCSLTNVISQNGNSQPSITWTSTSSPPAVILSASAQLSGIPASDIGLMAPQITELLPNPTGTGNDSSDEFVELYNPNEKAFDLSGFTIESGLTTKHDYTFDQGTVLPAQKFVAFYSSDTSLTLSNSGGQAWLLDPIGGIVSRTDPYGNAKDGQVWALANGKWQWSTTATPNAPNVISGASSTTGSKTSTTPTSGSTAGNSSTGSQGSSGSSNSSVSPIHPWTLAAVGSLAILYAGYEYRHDLANNFYRLRRYREARATAGGSAGSAGLDRIGQRLGRWQDDLRSWLGRWSGHKK